MLCFVYLVSVKLSFGEVYIEALGVRCAFLFSCSRFEQLEHVFVNVDILYHSDDLALLI